MNTVFTNFKAQFKRPVVGLCLAVGLIASLWLLFDVFPVTPDFLREKYSAQIAKPKRKPIEIQDIVKAEPPKATKPLESTSQRPNLDSLKPQVSSALKGFGEGSGGFGGDFSESGGLGRQANAAVDKAAIERLAKVVKQVDPRFPQSAREKNISGFVLVEVSVSSGGQPARIRILESQPPGVFDSAAMEALRSWVFEPAMSRGQPVASTVVQRVRFDLE